MRNVPKLEKVCESVSNRAKVCESAQKWCKSAQKSTKVYNSEGKGRKVCLMSKVSVQIAIEQHFDSTLIAFLWSNLGVCV